MQVEEFLNKVGNDFVESTREAMSRLNIDASGKSSDSVHAEVSEKFNSYRLAVYAGKGVVFTNQGRGPSRGGSGGGFTINDAKQWAKDKGIGKWYRESGKAMSDEEQAFLIRRKVHRKGFYGDNAQGNEFLPEIRQKTSDEIRATIKGALFDLVKSKLNYGSNKNIAA